MFSKMALIVRKIGLLGKRMREIENNGSFSEESEQDIEQLLDVIMIALDSIEEIVKTEG